MVGAVCRLLVHGPAISVCFIPTLYMKFCGLSAAVRFNQQELHNIINSRMCKPSSVLIKIVLTKKVLEKKRKNKSIDLDTLHAEKFDMPLCF